MSAMTSGNSHVCFGAAFPALVAQSRESGKIPVPLDWDFRTFLAFGALTDQKRRKSGKSRNDILLMDDGHSGTDLHCKHVSQGMHDRGDIHLRKQEA